MPSSPTRLVPEKIVQTWLAVQDPVSGEYAKARNSNLNEDLGKVEYVFSDKTGTLTSNEMQLREIAIKTIPLGSAEFKYVAQVAQNWLAACIYALPVVLELASFPCNVHNCE